MARGILFWIKFIKRCADDGNRPTLGLNGRGVGGGVNAFSKATHDDNTLAGEDGTQSPCTAQALLRSFT